MSSRLPSTRGVSLRCAGLFFPLLALGLTPSLYGAEPYAEIVLQDEAVAYWRFSETEGSDVRDSAGGFPSRLQGGVTLGVEGPQPGEFPDFLPANTAIRFGRGSQYVRVADPGGDGPLDFNSGDELTLEAWVRWDGSLEGSFPYIVGKGRTHNPGMSIRNQNYSLRIANKGNGAFLSFFFCDAETPVENQREIGLEGHRWTSGVSIPQDGTWHHLAVTYTFGRSDSLAAYIDGEPVDGQWDMGGATDKPPVVDDDELWIGSAMGGNSTFTGEIDEVAIYRQALTPEQIRRHTHINRSATEYVFGRIDASRAPGDHVDVEIVEGLSGQGSWKFRTKEASPLVQTDFFAMKHMPRKYNAKGLIVDRSLPALIHMQGRVELPAGEYEIALRSLDAARLYIDGELVAETPLNSTNGDAHQPYYEHLDRGPDLLSLAEGHTEQQCTVTLEGSTHNVSLYRLVGSRKQVSYLGEMIVAVRPAGGDWRILSPTRELPYTDGGWLDFLDWERTHLTHVEAAQRWDLGEVERQYWSRRHDFARAVAGPAGPIPPVRNGDSPVAPIDAFILSKLESAGLAPTPLVDDLSFLRRVSLDVTGVIPSEEQIRAFLDLPAEIRRAQTIDRLLADPAWADHWVGYWQDVLAENPGLTKPELNNTGPFRWFLHEAFLDNRPFDRFVTELVLMEGSRFGGGPAGFGLATQNDVPMAAKAHVVGTAFLGVEMKCARCHDAPYHDVKQQDLFSVAAMLKRSPEKVPGSSSIPLTAEQIEKMAVKVTLPPGSSVAPEWPFLDFVSYRATTAGDGPVDQSPTGDPTVSGTEELIPEWVIRNADDPRERLAALMTSPHNERFAQVIANRVWKRYLGRGLIEPVDDWEHADCSHPELLEYLSRELVTHGYDLKHLSRLILMSEVYQRAVVDSSHESAVAAAELLAGPPVRRRLTGEQLADSLLLGVGKSFNTEELTMDRDGRQEDSRFGHLGTPHRAWELVAVSNERDRPSLNLPVSQSVVDVMSAYGWRQQRQEPLTDRDNSITPLQALTLANGTLANRVADLSDESEITALCLERQPVEQLVTRLFQRLLTRPPSHDEQETLVALLEPGYPSRVVAGEDQMLRRQIYRSGITWSNHFSPRADEEMIRRQREVVEGDPPTRRLDPEWRQRAEDALWALINSPEFVIVP